MTQTAPLSRLLHGTLLPMGPPHALARRPVGDDAWKLGQSDHPILEHVRLLEHPVQNLLRDRAPFVKVLQQLCHVRLREVPLALFVVLLHHGLEVLRAVRELLPARQEGRQLLLAHRACVTFARGRLHHVAHHVFMHRLTLVEVGEKPADLLDVEAVQAAGAVLQADLRAPGLGAPTGPRLLPIHLPPQAQPGVLLRLLPTRGVGPDGLSVRQPRGARGA
mmetsp:Transcript_140065/g.390419  ORF Transcript_140065/g.390419 Transcript_140065/m.390419 type:complete len:220 (-) Transcript_140065:76-735(-)